MSAAAEQIAPKAASASWRPKGYGISPGLRRARLRFRLRNTLTGIAVTSFVVGVWAYSISAVKQDIFDDVDEEARALNSAAIEAGELATSHQEIESNSPISSTKMEKVKSESSPRQDGNFSNPPKGIVFAALGSKYPWMFEPTHKTFIWGAPPVDHPGRIQDRIVVDWKRKS